MLLWFGLTLFVALQAYAIYWVRLAAEHRLRKAVGALLAGLKDGSISLDNFSPEELQKTRKL